MSDHQCICPKCGSVAARLYGSAQAHCAQCNTVFIAIDRTCIQRRSFDAILPEQDLLALQSLGGRERNANQGLRVLLDLARTSGLIQ